MKDQLEKYVDLLFAGAEGTEDIKQEILQNTLDRYDDLIAQGKTPEAAYRLAISGIGDINEILSGTAHGTAGDDENWTPRPRRAAPSPAKKTSEPLPTWKKVLRALAVCLYIMCPIPLFVLQDETGLCGLLTFVGIATALMVFAGSKGQGKRTSETETPFSDNPQAQLGSSVRMLIWAVGLCTYFILSFATGAWWITWLIFPIIAAVQGLVKACMDLKGAGKHEN